MSDQGVFDNLPKFDRTKFQPPAWASGPEFDFTRKNGESSKSAQFPPVTSDTGVNESTRDLDDPESDEEEEVWQDAHDELETGVEDSPLGLVFTVAELRKLVDRAQIAKNDGNTAFTAKPPKVELAIEQYQSALKLLPPVPKLEAPQTKGPLVQSSGSGIQEITDEEADAITASEPEALSEREEVEAKIRECEKACHGNLAACWALKKEDKKAVEASNKALALDPVYTKALHRRATANDRIGSWSSLTSAKEDYEKLLTLIPSNSPQRPSIRVALSTLPRRIALQQDKEKDEMMDQLKTLGNGILGKFGLSTDMFKFEQQPGGGYGVKFE